MKRLIVIEAKIDDPSQAIRQAFHDRRFSSESYALLASESPTEAILKKRRERGAGLYLGAKGRCALKPHADRIPMSYVALKYNEWIARNIANGAAYGVR